MYRFYITVTLICLAIFTFVGIRQDLGPFIYLHPAPPKLTRVVQAELSSLLIAHDISSITLGRANDNLSDNVDVEVFAEQIYTFKIANPKLGKIKILRNSQTNVIRVFCQIPEDQPFNHFATALVGNLKHAALNVGRLKSIKATYE